jgi:endonuclease-3
LRRQQGPLTLKPDLPAIDQLIATVLSQHTSDLNSSRAFAALRARFPSWEAVLDAPSASVADAIRPGGLAELKAVRVQRILSIIREREGAVRLDRLSQLDDDQVEDYLLSLPGVGPKTAACVLTFSMGRSAFPVDTHVHRVSRRLGLIGPRTTAEKAHEVLAALVPPGRVLDFHVLLIRHGRKVCTARKPRCADCVLLDGCPDGQRRLGAGLFGGEPG